MSVQPDTDLMDSMVPCPILPPELEREIFEIAALSRPMSIPTMMRVAQRVKDWVEPLLYRTLFITYGKLRIDSYPVCNADTFAEVVRRKSATFLRDSVRNVMIQELRPDVLFTIFKICSRIENLNVFLTQALDHQYQSMPGLEALRPKQLHCALHVLFDRRPNVNTFTLPIFSQLTHLNLLFFLDEFVDSDARARWSTLGTLHGLTHLSLPSHKARCGLPILSFLLDVCKSLRALVVLQPPPPTPNSEITFLAKNDVRFVMMRPRRMLEDWKTGVLRGVDHWALADQFIAKRVSGEADRERFYLNEFDEGDQLLRPTSHSQFSHFNVPIVYF
ncbi:hypothetical protein K438DRAFT_1988480 [Mycena galopus ATCC 62051]|nr:hypothetical protein K438DRAFT_1988480 [Mycena galopus ATCC 62051]